MIAAAVTGLSSATYGFLELAGLPHLSAWVTWIVVMGSWAVARSVVARHYVMKNRLKVLRAERDWSQAQLADELGVARQTVVALETGKYAPSLPLAFKIGKLFRLPVEQIFQVDSPE